MKRNASILAALLILALVFTGYAPAARGASAKATGLLTETEAMMGTLENGVYENLFLHLRFAPGDEWTFFDRDELMKANGQVAGLLEDEDMAEQLAEAMEEGRTFYTMYAQNPRGETSSVLFQRLSATEALFGQEQATLEASMEPSIRQLESMGLTDVTGEIETVTIGGQEHPCLRIRGTLYGTTVLSDSTAIKNNNYLAMVNITCFSEKSLKAIYDAWQEPEGEKMEGNVFTDRAPGSGKKG